MKTIVDINDENLRLDKYLSELNLSRSKIQDKIKNGEITVNCEVKKPSYKLKENDIVEFEPTIDEEIKILPENIPLEVVWEDENMLVVNKPSGMLTHPTTKEISGTLVNALLYKYGENLSDINGDFRRGILHRLDRCTSGLLMVAKNNQAHEILAQQIKDKTARKNYLSIVKGVIKEDFGQIDKPIGRHPVVTQKMAVVEGAKESLTKYKVLERFGDATFVELDLITGRTHQIRVHMSYIHHPVYNDTLYGGGVGKVKTDGQVLQSYKLRFTKPFTDEIIELQVEPDEKIKKVLKYMKGKR